jgi:hypothetical protein
MLPSVIGAADGLRSLELETSAARVLLVPSVVNRREREKHLSRGRTEPLRPGAAPNVTPTTAC